LGPPVTADERADHAGIERGAALGRLVAFVVELFGDLACAAALSAPLLDPLNQFIVAVELIVSRHGAGDGVLAGVAAGPADRDVGVLGLSGDRDDNLIDQVTHDASTIGGAGAG
jgi:hypothetical protein